MKLITLATAMPVAVIFSDHQCLLRPVKTWGKRLE